MLLQGRQRHLQERAAPGGYQGGVFERVVRAEAVHVEVHDGPALLAREVGPHHVAYSHLEQIAEAAAARVGRGEVPVQQAVQHLLGQLVGLVRVAEQVR